jgi:hypothetical protein
MRLGSHELELRRRRAPSREKLREIIRGLGLREPRQGNICFELHFQCVVRLVGAFEDKFGKQALQKMSKGCFGSDTDLAIILRSGDIEQMRNSYREVYGAGPGNVSRLPIILDYLLNNFDSAEDLGRFLEKLDFPIPVTDLSGGGARLTRIAEYVVRDSVPELLALIEAEKERVSSDELRRAKEKAKRMEKRATKNQVRMQLVADICSVPLMENLFDLIPDRNVYGIKPYHIEDEAQKIVRRKDFYKLLVELSHRLREMHGKDKHLPALLHQHSRANRLFFIYVNFKDFWNGRITEGELSEAVEKHGKILDVDEDTAHVDSCGLSISLYRERILKAIKTAHINLTLLRVKLAIKLRTEYRKAMGIPNPIY